MPCVAAAVPDIPVEASKVIPVPMDTLSRHSMPTVERAMGGRGAAALRSVGGDDRVEVRVTRADGTEPRTVPLPPSAVPILAELLDRLAVAGTVAVLAEDAELSPEEAAAILGFSRPLVRRRMDAGLLPFRRVGTHRRVRLEDVLSLRAREAPARAALAALAADTDDLERAHGL